MGAEDPGTSPNHQSSKGARRVQKRHLRRPAEQFSKDGQCETFGAQSWLCVSSCDPVDQRHIGKPKKHHRLRYMASGLLQMKRLGLPDSKLLGIVRNSL